ncbi:hypothetical protein Syun_011060 [Stephania yunnanensis]|uniref:Uncharacterized protein n=1 Tax=Stephania yunnanensis TaxID=152371 RepID=A0AAP0JZ33_9MAGN
MKSYKRNSIYEAAAAADKLASSLMKKLRVGHRLPPSERSIFEVPHRLRVVNKDSFIPQTVSIGPIHHKRSERYEAMQNHKFHYLQQFLNRRRPFTTLEDCAKDCVIMLKGYEEKARKRYADDIKLTSDEFVEMMMLDGCFIVELFLKHWKLSELADSQYDHLFDRTSHNLQNMIIEDLLREAGVKFKAAPPGTHLLDIKFQNKTLEIPTIQVEDQTEPLFRNMIAYEQCYGEMSYMVDYFFVLNDLISSPSDVALLERKGIIINWLGDEEEVSSMVNKMVKNAYFTGEDFQYKALYKQLNDHYHTPWHRRQAKLKHDYFNSPWSLIAFLAAFAVLICTFIQTVCTIIQTVN